MRNSVSLKELLNEFIAHSPDFYSDVELPAIDGKHSAIIAKAYSELENFDFKNFRNWSAQGDLGAPAHLSWEGFRALGCLRGLLHPLYRMFFRSASEKLLKQALLDDVAIVRLIGADSFMKENPVHKSPGVSDFYRIDGTTLNFRWLRYIYLAKRILDLNILGNGGVWVDIGSYYGGLQGIVRKYSPNSRIVLVDFNHQLCRSYIYLKDLFPDAVHLLPDQIGSFGVLANNPPGSISYVPVSHFKDISNQQVDLVTNFFSLGEMTRDAFETYMKSELVLRSRKFFSVNRFVSAPFFEKTYESDLNVNDYLIPNRRNCYFDICPIHHYMLIERTLFERNAGRNISSSYFEFVSSIEE